MYPDRKNQQKSWEIHIKIYLNHENIIFNKKKKNVTLILTHISNEENNFLENHIFL